MNKNMLNLIEKTDNDEGILINKLIKTGIFTVEDVVREAVESKNSELIYLTALYVNGASIDELASAIIKTKDAYYIYEFALNVKGAPIDELVNAIIKTNNAEYIYLFARYVEGAPIDELVNAIIKTKNAQHIYFFAKNIEGAPIDKLVDAIIRKRRAEYIYNFARYVKGAPISKLWDAIKNETEDQYISLFYQEIILPYTETEEKEKTNSNLAFPGKNRMELFLDLIENEQYQQIEENKDCFRELFVAASKDNNKPKTRVRRPVTSTKKNN